MSQTAIQNLAIDVAEVDRRGRNRHVYQIKNADISRNEPLPS